MEETNTTPSPRASGPPHLRYLSLGAQAAVRLRPPTTPAVYRAARPTSGPGDTIPYRSSANTIITYSNSGGKGDHV